MTFNFEEDEEGDPIPGWTLPKTFTISKGEQTATATVVLDRSALTSDEDYESTFVISSADVDYEEKMELNLANNFTVPYIPTLDMIYNPYDMNPAADTDPSVGNTNSGWGTLGMLDGNPDTFMGTDWADESKFKSSEWSKQGSMYGVYFDVTIPNDIAFISVTYQNRSGNGIPTDVRLGVVKTGEEDVMYRNYVRQYTSTLDSAYGKTNTVTPFTSAQAAYSIEKLRFGVRKVAHDPTKDLYFTPLTSMTVAEFQLNVLY